MNQAQDNDYHLQSIRSAFVREALGGIAATESHLMQTAVSKLIESGMTPEDIEREYKARFDPL